MITRIFFHVHTSTIVTVVLFVYVYPPQVLYQFNKCDANNSYQTDNVYWLLKSMFNI